MHSTIEIFQDGKWVPAAEFNSMGAGPYTGIFEYRMDYVFGEKPQPISFCLPVSTERIGMDSEGNTPQCPAFLLDLVPQGRGRKHLIQELKVDGGESNDLLLAQHGAFNPVGNLRFDTAVKFFMERLSSTTDTKTNGFTLEEIIARKDEFLEHLWFHAMLTAGTTGVQGAAPKFLLTQNKEQLWFADSALADDQSSKHWLVKLPRGNHETDFQILRNEAAYLHVANRCGLRTYGEPQVHRDMLFVPRFDRVVDDHGLHRLHQESLASLAGLRGFGIPNTLFDLVEAFRPHVTHPVSETIEFMKRDILNVAMRNTDNHARNTAMQRLPNDQVQLTPLFDLAPMYMDREFIVRGCKWRAKSGHELKDWDAIIANTGFDDGEKRCISANLKAFLPTVERLPDLMRDCGVDKQIIDDCLPMIAGQVEQLIRLPLEYENMSTTASVANGQYLGLIMEVRGGTYLQDNGRNNLIEHDAGKFAVPLVVGDRVGIAYREGVPTVKNESGLAIKKGRGQ